LYCFSEDFSASSETVLRQQLVEFTDHHLIASRRMPDGTDTIQLMVDRNIVEQFLIGKGVNISIE
jgi:hypothetical protein